MKNLLKSKAFWAAILAIIVTVLGYLGFDTTTLNGADENILKVIEQVDGVHKE